MQNFRLSTAQVKFHQICTLIGSFCWEYIKFQLKRYRGVMSPDTEEWWKIWRKTNFLFQKWQEFGAFWSKRYNLHFDWSLLCKVYNVWPKNVQRIYISWDRSFKRFEEKLTCGLENDMRNLANFHQNTWKCQILYKLENPWAYREVLSYDKSEWWKIWKGIDLSFQNGHKEFDSRTRKSQKLTL